MSSACGQARPRRKAPGCQINPGGGLVDLEMDSFYPLDMDFHSLFYSDRFQDWKWCGPEDVKLAREMLARQAGELLPDYDERLKWFDLLQLAMDRCLYRHWFSK
jgi:hypothetical protein